MIPHSNTEGLQQAPFKYVPEGCYAQIVSSRSGGDDKTIDYEWCEVTFDGQQFWPYVASSWPEFITGQIPNLNGEPPGGRTANSMVRSYVKRKSRYGSNGNQEEYNVIINPARELSNNQAVPLGSIVWMMPSHVSVPIDTGSLAPGDEEDPPSAFYHFSYSDHGPYAIGFTTDSVPGGLDTDDKPKKCYWTEGQFLIGSALGRREAGKAIRFYPAATPQESQLCYELEQKSLTQADAKPTGTLPEICEVIRGSSYGESANFKSNRGWATWKQFAYQDYDQNGSPIYYGRWEIVSTDCSTEFMAKLKPSGTSEKFTLAPHTTKKCELQWYDPTNEDMSTFHQKGSEWVMVFNQTDATFTEDDLFNIYYDRQFNKYFCYALSSSSSPKIRHGKVVVGTNPLENIDEGPLEFTVNECDIAGDPFDPVVELTVTTGTKASKATSVFEDDVVSFLTDIDDVNVAVSDVFDDRMGTIKATNAATIPDGWIELEAARSRFLVGAEEDKDWETPGSVGGADLEDLAEHTHNDHPEGSCLFLPDGFGIAIHTRVDTTFGDLEHDVYNLQPPWYSVKWIVRDN